MRRRLTEDFVISQGGLKRSPRAPSSSQTAPDQKGLVSTAMSEIAELLDEYDRACAYTDSLWRDLSEEEVRWRPRDEFSPIAWHLGHQAAVAHFMIRNLTAAEPSPDPDLDALMDSATPETQRGVVPSMDRLGAYRAAVSDRVHVRLGDIDAGRVGAPDQLRIVARHLLTALVNHEYQHDQWIGEVRHLHLGHDLPLRPASPRLTVVDGYTVLAV